MTRNRERAKMILLLGAWLLFAVVQTEVNADPTKCMRTECKVPAQRKFKYMEDVTYLYKYSTDVSTNFGTRRVQDQPRNESTLHIDAIVSLNFASPCEATAKFANASISHDPSKYNPDFPDRAGAEFRNNLDRFATRFTFVDGRIKDLCPDKREPVWVLNLKRGVLSMLQNTMKRFDVDHRGEEVDVHGACETTYRLYETQRTSLIIKRTKNLATCVHGPKHLSIIQSNFYRSPRSSSHASSHPLLKSRSDCEITIDHNIYERVVCKDVHQLQPLSSGQTGARTEATAVLQLLEERKEGNSFEYEDENDTDYDQFAEVFEQTKRLSLLYDYSKTPRTMHGELRTSRDLLKSLCRLGLNSEELQQRFSETFTSFVHSTRLLDYPSLSQMFARANSICKTGRKHIIDALPFMGSNAAVTVMRELIMKKYINQATISNWVTTFAMIPQPNQATIEAVSPLLDFQHQIPDAQFILSYSAMIHAYCANNLQCTDTEQVTRFLSYLEQGIKKGCSPRSHSLATTKETIIALKAIGNMGLETESMLPLLKECIDDTGGFLPMELRVAAVDAHRRLLSCEKTRDQFFLDYYRNFTLDTEIRIASYLQVMRCPDYNVIKTIKHTLKVEEVNQVGTFVWSHLTNLYNSASPTMIEIQSLLTDRDLDTKFNSDIRKFSRNYDGSFFSEEYNFGANYQGNLIFSPKSYIPRSVTVNATLDLFGESVNVLEITTRLEGLEYYAEKFFGPDGPHSSEKMSGYFKSILRSFRAAPEDDYWKGVKRLPKIIDNNFDDPRISLSYKVFGNELKYTVLNGDSEIRDALLNLNPWEKFKQMASGKEIQYENTVMFLDSTYVVPMTSGLPVRLDFAGSAACNFKMSGLYDTKRISYGELELTTNIMPSVSVDVIGSMTVDAFYKSAGIKLKTSVYSSGAIQIHLNVKGTRLVRLSLGLPSKKMEVFSISTDLLFTTSNGAQLEEKPLGFLVADQDNKDLKAIVVPQGVISNTSCTWSALDRLVGLKLCVDYQFSNVTKNPNAPYFIFSGPTLFKVSLIKADPTAKSYLLEYVWEKTEDHSTFRLAFETPGSQINRELSATASFDVKSHNVTVLLRSAGNSVIAKGTYKNTENETFADISFNVNGVKHLDASIGYTRKKFIHGYTFSPKVYLTINNERVAALSGTIRNAQKNNVSQSDIDLTFQTKKVWSKLVGYIIRRNISLAGDFQLEYQLQRMPKRETLHLEVSLSNRSSRTLTHKVADMKLRSTAYPQLNTMITAWYQQALGHLELHAEVNSNPHLQDDRHKLTAQLIISYSKLYFQNQNTKVSALIAITKPIQNLDIKVGINHYSVGAESKTSLLVGYAPGKEISLVVNLIMPRGLMFSMEGHANLTIPNFNSMIINARVTERSRKEYELDFAGTWFSGHNVTARGTYIDRSVAYVISHSLKMILKSPSFASDILLNCKLYQNYSDIRVSLNAEQLERDKYAFILNHTVLSATSMMTYVEGRYKSNVYSVTTEIDTERQIRAEVHLDKWRDVHLALTAVNEENKKILGAEIKWDANRDPALKISTFVMLSKAIIPSVSEERQAVITFTYPGRLITASCRLDVHGQYNYILDSTVIWGFGRMINMSIKADYNVTDAMTLMKLESQLLTPFENWRRTALNAKYLQDRNSVELSSSAYWKDSQHVIATFNGIAFEENGVSEWKARCTLTSTVHSISWTTIDITQKLANAQTADTRLSVKYSPDKVINAWSIWHLDKTSDTVFNLTGNLHLESPVTNFKKSDMRCQLQILPDWKFLGATSLDLDKRRYTGSLIGDLRKLKESMIQFNVTTPVEKYAYIGGRFGLSESNRHVVAEIVTPAGPLGFEVLCQLFTAVYDFNVKLVLATPIDVLQKSLLVAKLGKREADFRLAYNNMTVGFQGVWHYQNITDFHYSYILFTPLQGLEESGVVTKLIIAHTEEGRINVDTEFWIRVAEVKIGIAAKGGPKPPPVNVRMKPQMKVPTEMKSKDEDDSKEDEEDEEDEEDNFYWRGDLEICAAIIEPIVGELDIDNEGPTFKVASTLDIPGGKIVLYDTFWMEDVFQMKNDLSVETPFKAVREIASSYQFVVDMEKLSYAIQFDFNVKRNLTWVETGVDMNYTYYVNGHDSKKYDLKLNIKTPLEFLKAVDTRTILDMSDNLYQTTVAIHTNVTKVEFYGSLEMEDGLLDTVLVAEVDSPMLKIPETKIVAKRDFTGKEKFLRISANIAEPILKAVSFYTVWQIEKDHARASVMVRTWIPALKNFAADLLYTNSEEKELAELLVNVHYLTGREYKLIAKLNQDKANMEVHTPASQSPHFRFSGDVTKSNDTIRINGELLNLLHSAVYEVSTVIAKRAKNVWSMETTMHPKSGDTDPDPITITLTRDRYVMSLLLGGHRYQIMANANFLNTFNWDVRTRVGILGDSNQLDWYKLTTFMNVQVNGNTTLYVHAESPLNELQNLTLNGNVLMTNNSGNVRINNRLNEDLHYAAFQWKLMYMMDMFANFAAGYQIQKLGTKDLNSEIFFRNLDRNLRNVDAGFDVDIDREKWKFAANATIGFRNHENVDGVFVVRLPPPDNDDHRFLVSYHANNGIQDMSYVVGYNTIKGKTNYASDGSIRMATRDIDGHLRLTWGMLPTQSLNNLFNVTFDNKHVELKYSLYTPKYLQQETLVFLFDYDGMQHAERRFLHANLFYPASTQIGAANISYESLINVNGTINAVLPSQNISRVECNFIVLTTLQRNKRFARFTWPQNMALINSEYSFRSEKLNSNFDGILYVEVPLNTRHIGNLTYGYKKRPQVTTGYSELKYNEQKVFNALYNSKGESRAGFEKDHIQITVENILEPFGILYINQYEYSAGNEGTNYPTVEFKHVNVYKLHNRTAFDVVGESRIKTTHTGQDIHLKAIHSKKVVQLKTDYKVLPGEFDQTIWVSLAEGAWMSYRINILNKTTEDVDNQFLYLTLAYPRRTFILDACYKITSNELKSDAKLSWDQKTDHPRTVGAAFNWKNISSATVAMQQQAVLTLKHPTFEKEVYLKGEVRRRDANDLLNLALTIDYSTDPQKLFLFSALLRDESLLPAYRKYIYNIDGKHPISNFDLNVEGHVYKYGNVLMETLNNASYKRSFLPGESGKLNGRVDLVLKEILFQRTYNEAVKYLYVRYYPIGTKHKINGSVINTPELNATGVFFLDPEEKLTWMMVNYTPDAVSSLRMYGKIPDARNAVFDIWRTYDQDYTVSDVSFYLKLNHSRLVTSTLRWRPELRSDIINSVKKTIVDIYESINNDTDYWKQYIKSETVSVISDVWSNAQEDLSGFLEDWNDLKELETDLKDLQVYLNESYNANDFYIKDIAAFVLYIVDELPLKSHIQSLPNILNEIWEIMGESGEAIRNSLLWIIETVKNACNKISEIISAILRGDSVSQVASIIEKLIEKYDKLIKDLHVSFIKYIENLWNKISVSISQQWNKFLLMVEPLFIRFIHYLETVVWKASKEVVDFLYDRGNDIIASPYFDRFTKFTQDIDKFYRDIKSNDIITNIQKYSALVIQFLKERYFTFVPFGKELKDVVDEIIAELKELQKLPSIHYALEKMQQVYDRVNYFYEYLEVRAKVENVIRLIHTKLMDIRQTALQAESTYREAKTKFIFDPGQGLMCLEQKLPMSWHAFNQTPEFHEIPEIRAVMDLKKYFVASNMTFWSLYYQYKPYTEPSNWLPPFRAQAMVVGSQHYVTFDGRHFDFTGHSTYLLARDFIRNTFTILAKYDVRSNHTTHQIIVLIGENAIELDIFNDTVKLINQRAPTVATNLELPAELENGTIFVYQEENVITVERAKDQFRLECNLKFNLCTLELAGWYYGKTSGLLGTMNNEWMDDTIASNGIIQKDIGTFAQSWALDRNSADSQNLASMAKSTDKLIIEFCEDLFVNRSSEFSSCFAVIDPDVYAGMCLRSSGKSEACTVAISYMQDCMFHDTYLRIPDMCTTCTMMDGSQVAEGQVKKLHGETVPRSTDVVFIVEAKECNRGIKQNRSMEQLIPQLSKELRDRGLAGNRWSLVVFGGDGVFERPRSIVLDGQIFTKNIARFVDYFGYVPVGDGSQDIFAAIGFASQLVFRAGVSKTFILMPCSHCESENQTLDYSVLHQVLLEHDITLHILMDADFDFEKEKLNKIFYGLDATRSYTKKDARILNGDIDLRRQVKLSKSVLGYCTPLSLEMNGTIFSSNKLRFDKLASIKKFASVFSKRVALTAEPSQCQHCECTADNNGVTRMECMPCIFPTTDTYNLTDSLSALQPLNIDYGQLDVEDD